MLKLLIENYLLLEVAGVKLKDIKTHMLNLTSTESYGKLQTLWNKRYKKYGNFIKRILTNAGEKEISEADLSRLISVLDRFESYANTSPLRQEIAKDWKKITVTLQDLIDFIEEQEHRIIYTEKDKKSLQEILSLCGPLDKLEGKTFSCEHYDIVLCNQYTIVVKPKSVKGSVAWALSDNNGRLERFGPNHLDPKHRITWCTSVYAAEEGTWNEFLSYFIGNLTTLFYVINRHNYAYEQRNRKICVGVDDIENEIIYDGLVTVDANNDPIEDEDGIHDLFDGDDGQKVLEAIFNNKSEPGFKLIPESLSKKDLKALYSARNKSTAARAMFRRFLLTNGSSIGDIEGISYCLDLLLSKGTPSKTDPDFINDIIKGIFLPGQIPEDIDFDPTTLGILEKIIKTRNLDIIYEVIDNIHFIVKEVNVDVFDNSLVPILKLLAENTEARGLIETLNEVISLIDLNSKYISLESLSSIKDKIANKINLLRDLDLKARSGSSYDLNEIFDNEVYKMGNTAINSSILKNPNLFNFDRGIAFVEDLLLNTDSQKHKYYMKYFGAIYEKLMMNSNITEYSKIKEVLYKYMNNPHMIASLIRNQYANLYTTFNDEAEFKNYISGVYIIHKHNSSEDSQELASIIIDAFNENSYSLSINDIDILKFSNEVKREFEILLKKYQKTLDQI